MTIQQRQDLAKAIFERCLKTLESKGADYSGQEDSLANFKRNADRLGMTKYQVWAVYAAKHIDSVFNSIKRDPDQPQVESEPLSERIVDIINYMMILHALLEEDNE